MPGSASKLLLLLLLLILHQGQWLGTSQLSLGQDKTRRTRHGKETK